MNDYFELDKQISREIMQEFEGYVIESDCPYCKGAGCIYCDDSGVIFTEY